jgi:activator of Hsp90 ATPase-like protein
MGPLATRANLTDPREAGRDGQASSDGGRALVHSDDVPLSLGFPTLRGRRLGELKLGGRYQLVGNAGGMITHCERPKSLELTWEIMGGTSWVHVRLTPERKKARLTLEHLAPTDGIGEEHLKRFGPAAVGVGWDLTLYGLELHLANPTAPRDTGAIDAWTKSSEGTAFMRASGEAWGAAHAASGEDPEDARARAERTIAFYTGS